MPSRTMRVLACLTASLTAVSLVGLVAAGRLSEKLDEDAFSAFRSDVVAYVTTHGTWEKGTRAGPFAAASDRFFLLDPDGRVLLPGPAHRTGEIVPAEVRGSGRPIIVSGRLVALAVPLETRGSLAALRDASLYGLALAALMAMVLGVRARAALHRTWRRAILALEARATGSDDPAGVEEAPGRGPAASREGQSPALGDAPPGEGGRLELPPLRVLVVDDDEYNRVILGYYLPSPPLQVDMAADGRAAVEAARASPRDVILMDLEMPVMGGLEAVSLIRREERAAGRRPCTIIALTSHDDAQTRQGTLAAGFDHYLAKPVRKEVLQRTLCVLTGAAGAAPAEVTVAEPAARAEDPVGIDADLRGSLPGFLASRAEAIGELEQALAAGDRALARRLAHRLAGSFGLYGFRWAAQYCRELEQAAAAGEPGRLTEAIPALRRHLETVEVRFSDER